MKRVVVDASVVLKWFLPDEEDAERALALLRRFVAGRLDLVAPSLLDYEVVNSLLVAGRRGRLGEPLVERAIESFIGLGVPTRDLPEFHREIRKVAAACRCSGHDAAYVALALKDGIPLITADARLAIAAASVHKDILVLGTTA